MRCIFVVALHCSLTVWCATASTACTPSDTEVIAANADCQCVAGTTNDCAAGSFCWVGNTCNAAAKTYTACTASDTEVIAANADCQCVAGTTNDCAAGSFCWVGNTCNAAAKDSAAAAKCASVKDEAEFCGSDKEYDETKNATDCATATCTKATAADVTACCTAAGAQVKVVTMTLKVENVEYANLIANLSLRKAFEDSFITAIVAQVGSSITKENVRVELTAGSVVATVEILPPAGVEVGKLATDLAAKATDLETASLANINAIPDIASVTSGGTITVATTAAAKTGMVPARSTGTNATAANSTASMEVSTSIRSSLGIDTLLLGAVMFALAVHKF